MTAHVDIVIVGAGPVGLMTANLLGRFGAAVLVVEVGERLIDYPRAVGIDDESLRTFQAAGLIDAVLPHIVSHQCQRVVNRRGRVLAELAPTAEEFGWPRKNGFVQPLIDAELLAGLDRYGRVEVRFGHRVAGWAEDGDGLEVAVEGPTGLSAVRASYIVGCDGGRSETRHRLGVSFEGQSSPTRWLVVDLRNDPLGHPNAYLGADPARPYASISIPHGIRRFEFMLLDHESDADAEDPGFVETLLRRHVPDPSAADVIRSRVYTHHSRIAGAFRAGRVLLAGDAAHLMPVWQGQGFNSGIRDAANLAWKLAAVVSGRADDRLLDTYDQERRAHALAMIRLSTLWGRFVSPTNRALAGLRDAFALGIGALPAAKAYVVGMKFKPMPRYTTGAVALSGDGRTDALVGRLLIQPRVATRERPDVLLDEVLGDWFSLVVWNNDPVALLDGDAHGRLAALGVHLVTARPHSQLCWAGADRPGVTVVGDRSGALNRLFDDQRASVLLVRPDRVVAGAVVAQQASTMIRAVCSAIGAVRPSADGPVRPAPASGSPFAART